MSRRQSTPPYATTSPPRKHPPHPTQVGHSPMDPRTHRDPTHYYCTTGCNRVCRLLGENQVFTCVTFVPNTCPHRTRVFTCVNPILNNHPVEKCIRLLQRRETGINHIGKFYSDTKYQAPNTKFKKMAQHSRPWPETSVIPPLTFS